MCKRFHRKTTEFKEDQFKETVSNTRQMWHEVDQKLEQSKGEIPNYICDGDMMVSSPAKLSNVFNDFFITKIETIRKTFTPPASDPVETLSKLIKRPETKFDLKQVSIQQSYNIISEMRGTNARGFDYVTSKTIKMIPHITSLWVNHLFNSVVRTSKFPKILKIMRILLILKPKKNKMEKTS